VSEVHDSRKSRETRDTYTHLEESRDNLAPVCGIERTYLCVITMLSEVQTSHIMKRLYIPVIHTGAYMLTW
jgi:hypothetical protein